MEDAMRYLVLIACLAVPAHADTSAKAQAYALAVGPSVLCNVPVDMAKAGAYVAAQRLDAAQVGQMVWAEQQEAFALSDAERAAYCRQVAGMVSALGLKP